MPYVSAAQRGWAHTAAAKRAGFPTKEFDKASKGQKNIPYHVKKKARHHKAVMKGLSGY